MEGCEISRLELQGFFTTRRRWQETEERGSKSVRPRQSRCRVGGMAVMHSFVVVTKGQPGRDPRVKHLICPDAIGDTFFPSP